MADKLTRWIKKCPPGFIDTVKEMDIAKIREEVVATEKQLQANAAAQESDQMLSAARENARDLSAGYREVKANQSAKLNYLMHVLREREFEAGTASEAATTADPSAEMPAN